ncbi:MAG: aminotransferase class I/II-fold pyridoxal phosphate-dependent enzyme [Rudanella sp.]|nr:aminotransferase class I/II-fold pyridoxal phosphate-dependent enzyme [Rudanella sp.]
MTDQYLTIDQLPNRFVPFAGRECLFFSGTSYLGMSQNPAFQALVAEEMTRYGIAFGSSRNGNLRLRVYEEAEATLARWTSAPDALTASSGMVAGQVVMNYLLTDSHTTFVYGPHAHPALWHETTVAAPTLPFTDWVAELPNQLAQVPDGPLVVALNAVDAGRSETYPFDWLTELPTNRPITLVVDDSHGLGVGGDGTLRWGIWTELAKLVPASVRLIVTASLAKAMGLPGGVILANSSTLAAIRQTSFFGGASPMAPAVLAAFIRAESLYTEAQQRLTRNVGLAEIVLRPTGLFRQQPGYPVFYTEHAELYAHLLQHNIIIYSFAYPTPLDKLNTRLVVSAFHEPADFERLGETLRSFEKGRAI